MYQGGGGPLGAGALRRVCLREVGAAGALATRRRAEYGALEGGGAVVCPALDG